MVTEEECGYAGGREVCVVCALCLSSSEVGGSAGEVDSAQRIESFESFFVRRFIHQYQVLLIGTEQYPAKIERSH